MGIGPLTVDEQVVEALNGVALVARRAPPGRTRGGRTPLPPARCAARRVLGRRVIPDSVLRCAHHAAAARREICRPRRVREQPARPESLPVVAMSPEDIDCLRR